MWNVDDQPPFTVREVLRAFAGAVLMTALGAALIALTLIVGAGMEAV